MIPSILLKNIYMTKGCVYYNIEVFQIEYRLLIDSNSSQFSRDSWTCKREKLDCTAFCINAFSDLTRCVDCVSAVKYRDVKHFTQVCFQFNSIVVIYLLPASYFSIIP